MDIDLETLETLLKEQEQLKKHKLKKQNDENRRRNSESSYSRTQKSENNYSRSRKIEKFDPLKINFKQNNEENNYDISKKKSFQYKDNQEEKTIMITNVSKFATRQELFIFIKENNMGKVDKIRFVKDRETGKMTGRAFIQFYNSEDAKNALHLTNKKFMGHTLKIVIALPHKKRDNNRK